MQAYNHHCPLVTLIDAGGEVQNDDEHGLSKKDGSDKTGIVLAISASAVMIAGALLAIAVKIRRSRE